MAKALKVKQLRGEAQCPGQQRKTLRALGLRGIGQENIMLDSRAVRGMLNVVHHLIKVEQVDESAMKAKTQKTTRSGYVIG